MKTVKDISVRGKRVLVRVDFNVPMDEKTGAISDDSRIKAGLPTIRYLMEQGARTIVASHLGRPEGKVVEPLRMGPVARRLSHYAGKSVTALREAVGPEVEKAVSAMAGGEVVMLENLRFYPGEEANDPSFAEGLSRLADIYVNDAFAASHRSHASVVGITAYLPSAAGFLLEKEVDTLTNLLKCPARPFAALVGGAKVSDKLGMMRHIMDSVDFLLVGGGMAATFLKAKSYEVGRSLVENDKVDVVGDLMFRARKVGLSLLLPEDVVVVDAAGESAITQVKEIPPGSRIADIGPRTIDLFEHALSLSETVFWNGPMGIIEEARFAQGSRHLAEILARIPATTIIGGGSTVELVAAMGLTEKMSFVSTGGGASLALLSGEPLPGVEALLGKTAVT
ncbi:MAG: phosphoglycerate kinase [Chloroflexi bacterium]|nr:phosphoglycerate kinase [Chloroflexota bacterium]